MATDVCVGGWGKEEWSGREERGVDKRVRAHLRVRTFLTTMMMTMPRSISPGCVEGSICVRTCRASRMVSRVKSSLQLLCAVTTVPLCHHPQSKTTRCGYGYDQLRLPNGQFRDLFVLSSRGCALRHSVERLVLDTVFKALHMRVMPAALLLCI